MSTKRTSPTRAKTKTTKTKTIKKTTRKSKMAKPNRFLCVLCLIILGVATIVAVTFITIYSTIGSSSRQSTSSVTDAEKFAAEYNQVPNDNVFVYKTGQEVIDILEHGTGAVFLGFPACPWCQRYAKYLDEVAKEQGIATVYYHNTYDDWQNNTPEYQKITEILSSTLQYDSEGHRHLYVPDVAFVVNGRLIGNDYESSKDTAGLKDPEEYWTPARVAALKTRLAGFMEQVKTADCDSTCDK
ncbi:hypothetical protein IK112_03105 [Candidatus Saccharibacteria bacterium]|nr:hypothetical protein [Candidatus Saccharibacteria bacterium]